MSDIDWLFVWILIWVGLSILLLAYNVDQLRRRIGVLEREVVLKMNAERE